MARSSSSVFLGLAILIVFLLLVFYLSSHKPSSNTSTTNTATSGNCDASLWNHVYHPQRLHIIKQCVTVTGTIDHEIKEPDGDIHIRLNLDAQYKSMLDDKNVSEQKGDLVLEPVCEDSPTQSDAESSCNNYHSSVVVPADGTHVSVTGSYVLDADHGWNEIHPVTSIRPSP